MKIKKFNVAPKFDPRFEANVGGVSINAAVIISGTGLRAGVSALAKISIYEEVTLIYETNVAGKYLEKKTAAKR